MRKWPAAASLILAVSLTLAAARQPVAAPPPQQAASATPPDVRIESYQDVSVRAGPGTEYDRVGALIPGQVAPILGRSPDGQWLLIVYIGGPKNEGWVYQPFVRVVGDLPSIVTVTPAPTPTLPPTSTPEFLGTLAPATPGGDARPPTFTAPAPLVQPTLLPAQGVRESGSFPTAVLIIVLYVLGTIGGVVSLLRLRS